jgi:hypothetical protein
MKSSGRPVPSSANVKASRRPRLQLVSHCLANTTSEQQVGALPTFGQYPQDGHNRNANSEKSQPILSSPWSVESQSVGRAGQYDKEMKYQLG